MTTTPHTTQANSRNATRRRPRQAAANQRWKYHAYRSG